MIPYDEDQVVAFAKDCDALLHPDSGRVGVNCARLVFDACVGPDGTPMGWGASRAKHLRELRLELGLPVPVDPSNWRGAFCIPDALPGIPYGDGKRIWTPAFGCYAGTPWQDRMIVETLKRRYAWFEYQLSGKPYRDDYPELALDLPRIVTDLTKLKRAGLSTIVSFRDDQGADLSYLKPVAAATQDLVDAVLGIYEANGVFGWNEDVVADVLRQQKDLYPLAINGFHSTTQDNGARGFGERGFWARVAPFTDVYFLQQSAWNHAFASTVDRATDFCTRLMAGANGWPTLRYGVVLFEESTSVTYRGDWTEAQGVAVIDRLMGAITPRPSGYMDGGTQ